MLHWQVCTKLWGLMFFRTCEFPYREVQNLFVVNGFRFISVRYKHKKIMKMIRFFKRKRMLEAEKVNNLEYTLFSFCCPRFPIYSFFCKLYLLQIKCI